MSLVPLIVFGNNEVAVAAERDDLTGAVLALRGRNTTAQAARFTLDRPVGDTLSVRIPPGVLNARRVLVTPIVWGLVADVWAAGAAFGLTHPVE